MEFEAVCNNSVNISIKATTSWIGNQLTVPVSIFSNLREEPFLCAKDANLLIIPFAAQLEILVAKKIGYEIQVLRSGDRDENEIESYRLQIKRHD